MKNIKVLGIDLAKNVFQLHGADHRGKCVLRKRLSRAKLMEFMINLPPCLVGIEACMGAHHWARTFERMGHTVKIMAPQFVKPYIRSNKNDRNDAAGIAEAVTRPDMKFVAVKKVEQQEILLLHRARALIMKQRTALSNQIRGLLMEFGINTAKGISHINKLPEILDHHSDSLTLKSKMVFQQLNDQFKSYKAQLSYYDIEIQMLAHQDAKCRAIMEIEGVGPLTASAAVAAIGDAKMFKNGREVSAWLGLTPKQHSSGNTIRLSGITKRGDRYIRTLLIHGARAVIKYCDKKMIKEVYGQLIKKYGAAIIKLLWL